MVYVTPLQSRAFNVEGPTIGSQMSDTAVLIKTSVAVGAVALPAVAELLAPVAPSSAWIRYSCP